MLASGVTVAMNRPYLFGLEAGFRISIQKVQTACVAVTHESGVVQVFLRVSVKEYRYVETIVLHLVAGSGRCSNRRWLWRRRQFEEGQKRKEGGIDCNARTECAVRRCDSLGTRCCRRVNDGLPENAQ